MKKILLLCCFVLIAQGCVTVNVSEQLNEDFPYNRIFPSDFNLTFDATMKTLESFGWEVEDTSRSSLTQKDKTPDKAPVLRAYIFTKIRQRRYFVASTYSTLNVRIETVDDSSTAVSIRYLAVTPLPPLFKEKVSHKNDALANKIYSELETVLGIK
ncbi:hypothetical protein ACFL38_04185 [Candidatus Omnitrophota bacterium]